jgi:hypothetical protein
MQMKMGIELLMLAPQTVLAFRMLILGSFGAMQEKALQPGKGFLIRQNTSIALRLLWISPSWIPYVDIFFICTTIY